MTQVKEYKAGQSVRVYSMWHGIVEAIYLHPSKLKFLPKENFSTVRIKNDVHTLPNSRINSIN